MSWILALDFDVVRDQSWGIQVARSVYETNGSIVWIALSSVQGIGEFEEQACIPHGHVLTNDNAIGALRDFDTHYHFGEVDRLVSNKDESLMFLFMMVLPCHRFVRFTDRSVFDFLTPPAPYEHD